MSKLKIAVIGVLAAVVGLVGFGLSQGDAAQAASRECGPNAIIKCGSMTETELASDYSKNNEKDLHKIFSSYGISSSMISSKSGVKGYVTKSGKVVVNGKTVATNAYSLGRTKLHGGTAKTISGKKYYEGPTSQRFSSSKLDAFVFFDKNGKFVAAILLVCGNPVRATPPTPPKQTPVYSCDGLTYDKISRNEFRFSSSATAKNGASIVDYTYNFGDGTTSKGGKTINHTYAQAGTYTATVTVNVKVNNKTTTTTNSKCKVTITVEKENCPIPGKEHLPKDSPECKEDKPSVDITKKVNGMEHYKAAINEMFNYEITVTNTGNVALKEAVVTDKAPKEVQLLPGTGVSGNTWTTTIAELGVGESQSFTIPAKYTKYAAGSHVNNVCVETPTVPGNPDDCDDASTETFDKEKVCILKTKEIKKIDKGTFDEKTMTRDFDKCHEVPPTTPPELPTTGPEDILNGVLGAGSLAGATLYYIASRRSL